MNSTDACSGVFNRSSVLPLADEQIGSDTQLSATGNDQKRIEMAVIPRSTPPIATDSTRSTHEESTLDRSRNATTELQPPASSSSGVATDAVSTPVQPSGRDHHPVVPAPHVISPHSNIYPVITPTGETHALLSNVTSIGSTSGSSAYLNARTQNQSGQATLQLQRLRDVDSAAQLSGAGQISQPQSASLASASAVSLNTATGEQSTKGAGCNSGQRLGSPAEESIKETSNDEATKTKCQEAHRADFQEADRSNESGHEAHSNFQVAKNQRAHGTGPPAADSKTISSSQQRSQAPENWPPLNQKSDSATNRSYCLLYFEFIRVI